MDNTYDIALVLNYIEIVKLIEESGKLCKVEKTYIIVSLIINFFNYISSYINYLFG